MKAVSEKSSVSMREIRIPSKEKKHLFNTDQKSLSPLFLGPVQMTGKH